MEFQKRTIDEIIEDSKTIDYKKIGSEVLVWLIANVENFIDNQNKIFKLDLVLDDAKGTEETKRLQDLYRAIPEDKELNIALIPGDEKLSSFIEEREKINKELENAEKCRRILDEITLKAFEHIKESKDLLNMLFERMIFYYGRVIPSPENKKRAMQIDDELRTLFNRKENAIEEEKAKIQEEIVGKIREGEKLIKFSEFEGSVSVTNFDYEAFDVGVKILEGQKETEDGIERKEEDRKVFKDYVIPEGFTVWLEINFKNKLRPTNMF